MAKKTANYAEAVDVRLRANMLVLAAQWELLARQTDEPTPSQKQA